MIRPYAGQGVVWKLIFWEPCILAPFRGRSCKFSLIANDSVAPPKQTGGFPRSSFKEKRVVMCKQSASWVKVLESTVFIINKIKEGSNE